MQQSACSNLGTSRDSPASSGNICLEPVSFCRCITLTERPSKERQGDVAEVDGGLPCLTAISNAHKLQNRYSLQPLSLPLEIRAFSKLPVIVCAKSPGNAKPLASYALPYLRASSSPSLPVQGAAVSVASPAVHAEELE